MNILNYFEEAKKIIAQLKENCQYERKTFNYNYIREELNPLFTGYTLYQTKKLLPIIKEIIKN